MQREHSTNSSNKQVQEKIGNLCQSMHSIVRIKQVCQLCVYPYIGLSSIRDMKWDFQVIAMLHWLELTLRYCVDPLL